MSLVQDHPDIEKLPLEIDGMPKLSTLVIVQKTVSLAALFLVGLALRNLFKLK